MKENKLREMIRKQIKSSLSEAAPKAAVDTSLGKVEKLAGVKMLKNALGQGWLLGETIITGIGQGYIQTTPIQLCLMTAQIGNGGYKIYPKIVVDDKKKGFRGGQSDDGGGMMDMGY